MSPHAPTSGRSSYRSRRRLRGLRAERTMPKAQVAVLSVLALLVGSLMALVGSSPASAAVTLPARSDAHVDGAHPRTTYGTLSKMLVDARDARTGDLNSYLRFDLSGYAGQTLQSAVLNVRTTSATNSGSKATQSVKVVGDDSWTERGITYNNAPAMGAVVGTLGPAATDQWSAVDLSVADLQSHVGSTLSLAIDTTSPDGIALSTRETASDPSLTLTFAPTDTTTPTPTPTPTPAPAPTSVYWSPSHMGSVRAGVGDPSSGWLKTISSPMVLSGTTVNQTSWRNYVQRARQYDQVEVPLVNDAVWKSGNLNDIRTVMRQFFQADPKVPVWELGLEENHSSTWEADLPATAQKLAAVEEVKNSVNPDIKLAYQIVNSTNDVEAFLKSDASNHVDILSLHLYKWPDFQAPEPWVEAILAKVKALEKTYDKPLPIWVTEAGAPTNELGVQLYSGTRPVTGLSLQGQAEYLTKMYATGLNNGVENYLWYEYKDASPPRCSADTDVECHFGIKFADGTPKPAYHAYATLARLIGTKAPSGWRVMGNTRISTFRSATQEVDVVWNYPAATSTLPLSTFGATAQNTTELTATGEPVAVSGDSVKVTGSPIILTIDR